ncbi:protein pangolin, isoforms A/H/I/S-like isoform X1 [Ornithodoros turicata]|uniref:protein pangolin, isoforms A/H/I/S-like isoform X1 n=1 Tax=Ornithodoros turicata TaxID=34597 RepID=UPI003139870F
MPHGGGGDDLASSDEIKVFKDEGEEEKRSSENLTDLKSSLVTEGEEVRQRGPVWCWRRHGTPLPLQDKVGGLPGQTTGGYPSPKPRSEALGSIFGKSFEPIPSPFGYAFPHYPNGALGAAVSMASKAVPPHPGSPLGFMVYNEPFSQPPPAHMGIPPVHIDPKTGENPHYSTATLLEHASGTTLPMWIHRPSVYPLPPPAQYPHPVFSHDFAQQLQWHSAAAAGMYSMPPMSSAGFRSAGGYPPPLHRLTPPLLSAGMVPHGLHPALVPSTTKQDLSSPIPDTRHCPPMYTGEQKPILGKTGPRLDNHNGGLTNGTSQNGSVGGEPQHVHSNGNMQHNGSKEPKKNSKSLNHVKKPLNAFMLYMKEMRAKVVAECTLKESAAINQILGRRWHSLSREEQSKYYEMARKERQLHMQLHPGWTARDNYAVNSKRKKRKKDKAQDGDSNNPKKCRARYGLDQQSSWCKPCRRKKKCIRYQDGLDNTESEDNMGSVEAPTPESHSSHGGGDATTTSSGSPCTSLGTPEDPLHGAPELSLSSPQPLRVPSVKAECCAGLKQHHPLSIQHLTGQPLCKREPDDCVILTPPSTDSSTTAIVPPLLTVT